MSACAQNYAYICGQKKPEAKEPIMSKEEYERRIENARKYMKPDEKSENKK